MLDGWPMNIRVTNSKKFRLNCRVNQTIQAMEGGVIEFGRLEPIEIATYDEWGKEIRL
jgi:hypothetical protein